VEKLHEPRLSKPGVPLSATSCCSPPFFWRPCGAHTPCQMLAAFATSLSRALPLVTRSVKPYPGPGFFSVIPYPHGAGSLAAPCPETPHLISGGTTMLALANVSLSNLETHTPAVATPAALRRSVRASRCHDRTPAGPARPRHRGRAPGRAQSELHRHRRADRRHGRRADHPGPGQGHPAAAGRRSSPFP